MPPKELPTGSFCTMSNFDCNVAAKTTYEDFDLNHIFQVAKKILEKRNTKRPSLSNNDFFIGIMNQYGSTISDLSREMTCKLSETEDEKTDKILKGTLRNYTCKAQMVLAVAALALKCGKHPIIPSELPNVRNSKGNPMMKSIWLLQQLDIISDKKECLEPLKKWLESLQICVQGMMRLTDDILKDNSQISKDEINAKRLWTVKVAVVCSSQITAAHLLLLSGREKLFQLYASKLKELYKTFKEMNDDAGREDENVQKD